MTMLLCDEFHFPVAEQGFVVVLADNIASYYFGREDDPDTWGEWPDGLCAPWPKTWIEFSILGSRFGVQVYSHPTMMVKGGEPIGSALLMRFVSPDYPSLDADLAVAVILDMDGKMVQDPFVVDADWDSSKEISEKALSISEDTQLRTLPSLSVALLTFIFANCRNVTVRDEKPRLTRQQRRHGPPAITYKVLDITPMTRVLRDEGDIEHNGIKKALHICRGHFSHYTSEKPLFGKYEGTFWTPMHLRGSAKHGIVVKDYQVEPRDDLP